MLDTFTLLVLLCLTHFLSTMGLAVVWWINRTIPGVGEWALGRLVGVFGLGVLALRLWVDPAIAILLGNSLLMIGFSIVLTGHRKFMGRPPFPLEGFALALSLWPTGAPAKNLSCKLVSALFVGHTVFNLACLAVALIDPVGPRFLETALISQADEALYRAKMSGRNAVRSFVENQNKLEKTIS